MVIMNEQKNTDSLLETAIKLLQSKKKPKKIKEIIRETMTKKGYTTEEAKELAPQFILDFMASGYFVYCGDDSWDLKDRQPINMLDKDGGDFEDRLEELDEVIANELKDDEYVYDSKDEIDDSEEEDDDDDEEDDISKEFAIDEDEPEFDAIKELEDDDEEEEVII